MSRNGTLLWISAYQSDQLQQYTDWQLIRNRGVWFPLSWKYDEHTGNPTIFFTQSLGNGLQNTTKIPYGESGCHSSRVWFQPNSYWHYTNEDTLRSFDYVHKKWWYVQPGSLYMTENVQTAARFKMVVHPNTQTTVVLYKLVDNNTQLSLDLVTDSKKGLVPIWAMGTDHMGWSINHVPGNIGLVGNGISFDTIASLSENSFSSKNRPGGINSYYLQRRTAEREYGVFGKNVNVMGHRIKIFDTLASAGYEPVENYKRVRLSTYSSTDKKYLLCNPDGYLFLYDVPSTKNNSWLYQGAENNLYVCPHPKVNTKYGFARNTGDFNYSPSTVSPYGFKLELYSCDNFDDYYLNGCQSLKTFPSYYFRHFRLIRDVDHSIGGEFGVIKIMDTNNTLCFLNNLEWGPCELENARWNDDSYSEVHTTAQGLKFPDEPEEKTDENCYTLGQYLGTTNVKDLCCRNKLLQTTDHVILSAYLKDINNNTVTLVKLNYNVPSKTYYNKEDNLWVQFTIDRGGQRISKYRQVSELYIVTPDREGYDTLDETGYSVVIRMMDFSENSFKYYLLSQWGQDKILRDFEFLKIEDFKDLIMYVDVRKFDFTLSSLCGSNWCAFGSGCTGYTSTSTNADILVDFCGSTDAMGLPRVYSDPNCVHWCDNDPKPNTSNCLLKSVEEFCTKYPENSACLCKDIDSTAAMQRIKKSFEASIPGGGGAIMVPPSICWAQPCTENAGNEKRPIMTKAMLDTLKICDGMSFAFCNQVINIEDIKGNVSISEVDFKMVCGGYPYPEIVQSAKNELKFTWKSALILIPLVVVFFAALILLVKIVTMV